MMVIHTIVPVPTFPVKTARFTFAITAALNKDMSPFAFRNLILKFCAFTNVIIVDHVIAMVV